MNAHRLMATCPDCDSFGQPLSLWITSGKHLLVTCYCISCEKNWNVIFPLTMLYKSCPLPSDDEKTKALIKAVDRQIAKITNQQPQTVTTDDTKWLKSMGTCFLPETPQLAPPSSAP